MYKKIDVIPYMFYGAYTDCYILYRATRYLISFFRHFHLRWVRNRRHCFCRFTHKKRNSKKKSDCFSLILSYKGYNLNHPHTVHDPQEVFRWSPVQIASEAHFSWSVTFFTLKQKWQFFLESNARPKTRITPMFFAIFQKTSANYGVQMFWRYCLLPMVIFYQNFSNFSS